ncbi:SlyX family protein [Rhizobium sp. L1K21]|uniref:SlyX family protein n=1 Tax=Rhizobium sp. L1K21 TaxID=2954933 RepID=UPI002093B434|nr:SlyX family protein [Rhizobium sp. L1K21]MCO6187290.1 SlyX family protein [Rhizobium sp. L1K21]
MDNTEHQRERIEQLEMQVAFQERTIEELSGQIAEHWKLIDRLTAKLDALTTRFLAVEEGLQEAPPITKPPHY